MKLPIHNTAGLAFLAGIALSTPAFAVVTIDYVTVGNAGNAADPADGDQNTAGVQNFGRVDYAYQIGKNEVTISQYAEFLNNAAKTDTHGLWNSRMGSNANIAGITRGGNSGSFSYSVTGSGLRPITFVSWFDAARFTNWMHNGQGSGSTETGAYTLNGNIGLPIRNLGANVWIPSENEWYKAAYYDPTKGGTGGYWLHANQSDSMTSNNFADPGAANYGAGDFATTPGNDAYSWSQNYLTDVGAYGLDSESSYGTNDQAGNVWEWNDAVIGSSRGLRGGSWLNYSVNLPASYRFDFSPSDEGSFAGFRVASVPEPSALLLTLIAASVSLTRRRRSPL